MFTHWQDWWVVPTVLTVVSLWVSFRPSKGALESLFAVVDALFAWIITFAAWAIFGIFFK